MSLDIGSNEIEMGRTAGARSRLGARDRLRLAASDSARFLANKARL